MGFSKSFSVLVCLAIGFVACNSAPTLDTDALTSQTVVIKPTNKSQQLRQVGTGDDLEPENEVVVGEYEIETEEVQGDLEQEIDEDDFNEDDWDGIWNPEWGHDDEQDLDDLDNWDDQENEDDDDYWIGDDDWEDDFDYIDNKVTAGSE